MEANEAMKAMARRIVAQFVTCPAHVLDGKGDDWPEVKSALAAIMETQRLDAELAARFVGTPSVIFIDYDQACKDIEAEILLGEHYALEGDRHG